MTYRERLEADGYAFVPAVFGAAEVSAAIAEWAAVARAHATDEALLGGYGARNVLDLWPLGAALARREPLRNALLDVLGPRAGVVRGLYFDKPPGRSWALPWHKDYSIAVRAHAAVEGFAKPTTKAGVPHLVAPRAVLDRMLTARVHLDDMTDENGPLRVIPGSHAAYDPRADPHREAAVLRCRAGDVLLMRPLVTHASGHSRAATGHRRIVHLECAAAPDLPGGLAWRWFVPLA